MFKKKYALAARDESETAEYPLATVDPPAAPCCGDHVNIPFHVDQEFKDSEGKTYAVRVTQCGCLAPGAVPVSFLLNLDQLPKAGAA